MLAQQNAAALLEDDSLLELHKAAVQVLACSTRDLSKGSKNVSRWCQIEEVVVTAMHGALHLNDESC